MIWHYSSKCGGVFSETSSSHISDVEWGSHWHLVCK